MGRDEDSADDAVVGADVDPDPELDAVDALEPEPERERLRSWGQPSSLGETNAYLGTVASDGSTDLER